MRTTTIQFFFREKGKEKERGGNKGCGMKIVVMGKKKGQHFDFYW